MHISLPILDLKSSIIDALISENRLVLRAPTGSGKSTQVPQYLRDSGIVGDGRILVLQPRRIAARMLATRVAYERNGELGLEVGYQTRFDRAICEETTIRFITEGILPRLLLSDTSLPGISAVIFDEFHERSLTTDAGLALVKRIQDTIRPDLKLIIMSATIDTGPLEEYLDKAPVLESDGRVFPVDIRYSPTPKETPIWIAATQAVRYLLRSGEDGDILVFMPGAYEIRRTVNEIKSASLPESCAVFPLYGDLPASRQQEVLESAGRRKVIVATNIAETSLTIPGVRHVIDSGLARIHRYDPSRGFNMLNIESISQDSADQRAGRAGREAPGIAIRLWSETSHLQRPSHTAPEIHRVDLTETVLQLKALGEPDPAKFDWFDPPNERSLETASQLLDELGAVDSNGKISEHGRELVRLPAHPRLGKLLLEGLHRGVARSAALAAAILSERPVRVGKERLDRLAPNSGRSDFAALAELITKAREADFDPRICSGLGIHGGAARQVVRTQAYFLQVLRRQHEHTLDEPHDPNALNIALLLAYPDRLAKRRDQGTLICEMSEGRKGELDNQSRCRREQLLVVTEIREIRNRNQPPKTVLGLAAGVDEEWLVDYYPDRWVTSDELEWHENRKGILRHCLSTCLGVTIEYQWREPDADSGAGEMLARMITEKDLPLQGFDSAAKEYMERVQWLAEHFPDQGLPSFDNTDIQQIVGDLCSGEWRYERVRKKMALPYLQGMVGANMPFVEQNAPTHVKLPSGRRLPIKYTPGHQPRGRTRIQDLYDMNSTPTLAGGTVPLLIEILAPNNRPVQVTDDLAGFWKTHYSELKKSLSRRYPKHEWR